MLLPVMHRLEALTTDSVEQKVSIYLRSKGILSPLLAAALCIVLVPVIAVLYLLVRLTSSGPGFYSQVRLGRNGQRFMIYKLRTMVVDAEKGIGPVWATPSDPRVTPIGRVLRKYHLDELPQIFNVLKGEMCFVGPRPERPEIAFKLAAQIPNYFDRLLVKPGITGMAQLHLPPDTNIESVRRKLSYELAYLSKGNWALDVRVVTATALKVLPGSKVIVAHVGHCADFFRLAKELFEISGEKVVLSRD